MREPLRIYQSDKGIWRVEMRDEDTDKLYYTSLRTRDQMYAERRFAAMRQRWLALMGEP